MCPKPREEIVLTNDAFIECYVARRRHFLPATFFKKKMFIILSGVSSSHYSSLKSVLFFKSGGF